MQRAMLFALCLLTILGVASLSYAECPAYWTRFRRHCYRFFGAHKTWSEAEGHCNSFSSNGHSDEEAIAHLVSINSQAENDFIYTLWASSRETAGNASQLWLGFYKPNGRNYFTWSDSRDIDFTFWDIQRPNNVGGNEDCVEMWEEEIENHRLKSWNDRPCLNRASYICKMQLD
ncbi:echinoidin-like [Acanthaster planci]|uniref:Echinoidin-like n=1 Tax=Acanthaster planci TaxID=133434 RepID=A0A8B7YZH0_ACAPL|nr:echinoidin-like [Acanthaster planci]XP_022097898.1 echinoidin-like [Acanthaster planci]XP_022097899.1 echinoidin-like [Acanthaster planci]XP_022097900.1 echinoidin-like [Acanthaster planci]XP_022097901.1 echinoidin-like [Acanthaster planci]XP_022097902.1 echinoidin-like [Acanthaster planci]